MPRQEHIDLWRTFFPEFIRSSDSSLEHMMQAASILKLPAGKELFYPGSLCQNYLLMLEGCVRTQLISENGREILLYHVRSGDSCVLTTSCLLSGERYPAEGMTEEASNAFLIPGDAFHQCLDQSAYFRQFVFKNFALRMANVIKRMEEVMFGPVDLRLSRFLLATNKMLISKTHQDLAAELGTAREVVSRQLKRFEANGWVKLHRGSIEIIDFIALRNMLGNREQ